MTNCIFCKISKGEIPSKKIHEDQECFVIRDIAPLAKEHVLVIPKVHCANLVEAPGAGINLEHLLRVAGKIAQELGIDGSGFRTVINTGADGGQTVFHLHIHVLGGEPLGRFV